MMKVTMNALQRAASIGGLVAVVTPIGVVRADDTLSEVVVTAQRRVESIQQVPLSVAAATAEQLEQMGISDIRDLGHAVPGLSFMSQGPFAEPAIRGVQGTIAQAGADSPIALYLDGVYQPNQLANIFDLADVTQVEVLKGPQGTLFGRNATGGAISIHTLQPSFHWTGNLGVDYGYYNGSDQNSGNLVLKGYVSGPIIEDKLAFGLSINSRDMPGYLTDDVTGGRSGEVKTYTLRGKLLLKATDDLSFLLMGYIGNRFDLEAGSTTAFHGNSSDAYYPGGIASTMPWHVASDLYKGGDPIYGHDYGGSLKIDYDVSHIGTLSSLTAYSNTHVRYDVDLSTGTSALCSAAFVCLNFAENYPDETFQQEINFTSEKFDAFSFVGGLFYYHDNHVFGANIDPELFPDGTVNRTAPSMIGVEQSAKVNTRAKAVFGEGTYDITSALHVIGGLRYSVETKWGVGTVVPYFPTTGPEKDSSTTPRVSVRYDLLDSTNVYFTYSKGFKSAVLSGFEQTNNVAKPETLNAFEIGIKSEGQSYRMSAAAFLYNYRDLQAQFWNGTGTILANAAGAKMRGAEISGLYRLSQHFRVDAGLSWLGTARYDQFSGVAYSLPQTANGMTFNVIDASGQRMLKSPKLTADLTLTYSNHIPVGDFELSGSAYNSSSYFFDLLHRVQQGDYTTLNAEASLSPDTMKGFRFGVFGKNLTNKAYIASTLLGPSSDAPVYSPPREIGVRANYAF